MRYQNLKAFEKHISSAFPDQLCRVYLVVIQDDFERSQVLGEFVKKILSPENVLVKVAAETEIHQLCDVLNSPSLFGGEPVVVMDHAESLKKKEADALAEWVEKASLYGYLLFGAKAKTPLIKAVEKAGVVLDMSDEKPWEREKRLIETLSDIAKREGKRLASDAPSLLIERLGTDFSLLCQELAKLLCYVGDRPTIERADIFRISYVNHQSTIWQLAEEIVWERGRDLLDSTAFASLVPSLRQQLQMGLKITSLLEGRVPVSEWGPYFPKVWPKTLEKRKEQAAKRGGIYFRKGLDLLYRMEVLSRSGSHEAEALLDIFRAGL